MAMIGAALLDDGIGAADAVLQLPEEVNPLQMPTVGTSGLRVISPKILELELINTKAADPARVSSWDFVGDNSGLRLPTPGELRVLVAGQPTSIQKIGFKRHPVYAPLKARDFRIANYLYLQLSVPAAAGQTIEISTRGGAILPTSYAFATIVDPLRWSPALHVNQVGYLPERSKKAMVGYFLGSLGELSVDSAAGFQLLDDSNNVVFTGPLTRRADQGYTYSPAPYQQVWEADFTAFTRPGRYRLAVPGLGTSYPFLIDEGLASAFARAYALGLYQQRCGAKLEIPFSRHVHDVCHARPVEIPDLSFAAVNRELAQMSSDYAEYQTAPQLKDVNSSLYPFFDLTSRDVSGGHHDAGDYSKYTINSAGLVHYLVFAVDAFPGVAALDNLGLPESGDGKSDILQEAKWEADFLAKMQDLDGGFYFLVYPRDREYENDVLPDKGDPQVVFPKTTAVTAAAVAALAEAGSSPTFRREFPGAAAIYLQKARLGWAFLEKAIGKYGKAGAYQKITHYGNEFGHDDELAWAASALFVATGNQAYHEQLKAWYDPSDPKTRRWSWWRLFEGYGCAARSYAFAARSGRLPADALDQLYLSKCEAEILAAAEDHVRFARQSAYGTSFPEPNKTYRSAGWYFSSERAFDITVAYQISSRLELVEAVLSNLNYEGGCNPVNVSYITGLGTHRQREIVHQYAQNDRQVLPPSGLPLGNVQAGFQYLYGYLGDLEAVTYPPHAAVTAPYPYYDRWADTFNTTTEFVITDQARSLASLAYWMSQTAVARQTWSGAKGAITGLPRQVAAEEKVTAALVVPGLDLAKATVVWEARDQEPQLGNQIAFAAKSAGEQWVEVEAQLPDGRRVAVVTNFMATASLKTPPNSYQSSPLTPTPETVALFHLDTDTADATGFYGALLLEGKAELDSSNLGWMSERRGAALHFGDLGDKATLLIPAADLQPEGDPSAIVLEAMIYVDSFVGYNRQNATLISMYESWDAFLALGEDRYAGPYVRAGTTLDWTGPSLESVLTLKSWHHLAMEVNRANYVVRVDGKEVANASSSELANWGRGSNIRLELGNFSGWIDEVVVRSIRTGGPPNRTPSISMVTPAGAAVFAAPAAVILSAVAADVDGTVTRVEFYADTVKVGEVANGAYPYTFVWNGVPAGTYSITAKANDDRGASALSAPVSITVEAPSEAVAKPTFTPPGGSFLQTVTVQLSTATSGATMRYTTDGTEPNANSPVYSEPLRLSNSTALQARSFKHGLADSALASTSFQVTTTSPSGARVTFIGRDSETQGNWKGVYGREGSLVLGSALQTPRYLQISTAGQADYAWRDSVGDVRELQKPDDTGRVAGVWYSSTEFSVTFDLSDGKTHRTALYFLDWDRARRVERVEILDGATDAILDTQIVSQFEEGKYLVWDLKGRLKLRFIRIGGPNALLSGLFFDPNENPSTSLAAAPLLASPARQISISLDGFQVHVSGEASQRYVFQSSSNLVDWSPISTNLLIGSDMHLFDLEAKRFPSRFYRVQTLPEAIP